MKQYFNFIGNPIIDNGISVLANIARKNKINEVKPEDIKNNIDSFFLSIKHQYNADNASAKEKKHSKRKLKQHLTGIYTTNHYIHGINNKSKVMFNITIAKDDIERFFNELNTISVKKEFPYSIVSFNKNKGKIKIIKKDKTRLERNKLREDLETIFNNKYKIKKVEPVPIETNEEYFEAFKNEVIDILDGKSKILNERKNTDNLCVFCGKASEIVLTKDLFPLTSSIDAWNLGRIYSCRYCYLATLFYFFNLINVKKDEKSSGMYFFYHFSDPIVMIEYSKIQIEKLKNERLASLQTIIGGKYSSVFNDLYKKVKILSSIKNTLVSVTVYFLLNDNRGAQYDLLNIPCGLLNFWIALQSPELTNEWAIIHFFLHKKEEYVNFINGDLPIWKFNEENFPILKKETVKVYLKEVVNMNEELIKAVESLASNLKKYFQIMYERGTKKRKNWLEDFYDFFSHTKPLDFFYNILKINNDYFKISGENLISTDSVKLLLSSSKLYNTLFYLLEYFILNSLNDDEKKLYLDYVKDKTNA